VQETHNVMSRPGVENKSGSAGLETEQRNSRKLAQTLGPLPGDEGGSNKRRWCFTKVRREGPNETEGTKGDETGQNNRRGIYKHTRPPTAKSGQEDSEVCLIKAKEALKA